MKWEYHYAWRENVGRYYDDFIELVAKPLGEDGWELIHISERKNPDPNYPEYVHLKGYFRRPVQESIVAMDCSEVLSPEKTEDSK